MSKNLQCYSFRNTDAPNADRVGRRSSLGLYDDHDRMNCGRYRVSVSLMSLAYKVLILISMWRILASNATPYPEPRYPAVNSFGEISNFMSPTSTSTSVTTSNPASTLTSSLNFAVYIRSLELRLRLSSSQRKRATSPSHEYSQKGSSNGIHRGRNANRYCSCTRTIARRRRYTPTITKAGPALLMLCLSEGFQEERALLST